MKYGVLSHFALVGLLVSGCVSEEDYFSILGISKRASKNDIKKAFRQLSKRIHPDRNRCDPEAAKKFILLKKAYDVLLDKDQRLLYRRRNPGYGDSVLKYDWDLPECYTKKKKQKKTTTHKVYNRSSWNYLLYLPRQTKRFLYKILALGYGIVTRRSFGYILYGILLYVTADFLSKRLLFHFLQMYLVIAGTIHLLIIMWLTTALQIQKWKACGISSLVHLLWVYCIAEDLLNSWTPRHLFFQQYIWHVYSLVVLMTTLYYYRKYSLHKYSRYVAVCNILLKALGMWLIYISMTRKEMGCLLCGSIIIAKWTFPKVASYCVQLVVRFFKYIASVVTLSLNFSIDPSWHILILMIKVCIKNNIYQAMLVISWTVWKVILLVQTMIQFTFSVLSAFILYIRRFDAHNVINAFIQTLLWSNSSRGHKNNIKSRLLTSVEFVLEGRVVTRKELNKLRKACQDPNHIAWKTLLSKDNVSRFILFMRGGDHVTEQDRLEHERLGTQYPARDDINDDDSDDDLDSAMEEENEFEEDLLTS